MEGGEPDSMDLCEVQEEEEEESSGLRGKEVGVRVHNE